MRRLAIDILALQLLFVSLSTVSGQNNNGVGSRQYVGFTRRANGMCTFGDSAFLPNNLLFPTESSAINLCKKWRECSGVSCGPGGPCSLQGISCKETELQDGTWYKRLPVKYPSPDILATFDKLPGQKWLFGRRYYEVGTADDCAPLCISQGSNCTGFHILQEDTPLSFVCVTHRDGDVIDGSTNEGVFSIYYRKRTGPIRSGADQSASSSSADSSSAGGTTQATGTNTGGAAYRIPEPEATPEPTTAPELVGPPNSFLRKGSIQCIAGASVPIGAYIGLATCKSKCSSNPDCYGFNYLHPTTTCTLRTTGCIEQMSSDDYSFFRRTG